MTGKRELYSADQVRALAYQAICAGIGLARTHQPGTPTFEAFMKAVDQALHFYDVPPDPKPERTDRWHAAIKDRLEAWEQFDREKAV